MDSWLLQNQMNLIQIHVFVDGRVVPLNENVIEREILENYMHKWIHY